MRQVAIHSPIFLAKLAGVVHSPTKSGKYQQPPSLLERIMRDRKSEQCEVFDEE